MKEIRIKTIPHFQQRYNTCGDWVTNYGKLSEIFISEMDSSDSEFAVAVHELIEGWLCVKDGITQGEVDIWDTTYELDRPKRMATCGCIIKDFSEPGCDPHAPYFDQHMFAIKIEKQLVKKVGMTWKDHNNRVEQL